MSWFQGNNRKTSCLHINPETHKWFIIIINNVRARKTLSIRYTQAYMNHANRLNKGTPFYSSWMTPLNLTYKKLRASWNPRRSSPPPFGPPRNRRRHGIGHLGYSLRRIFSNLDATKSPNCSRDKSAFVCGNSVWAWEIQICLQIPLDLITKSFYLRWTQLIVTLPSSRTVEL